MPDLHTDTWGMVAMVALAVLITVCCALACWPTRRRRRDDSVKVGRL